MTQMHVLDIARRRLRIASAGAFVRFVDACARIVERFARRLAAMLDDGDTSVGIHDAPVRREPPTEPSLTSLTCPSTRAEIAEGGASSVGPRSPAHG